MKYQTIVYYSENGYTGILYGKSSYIITDSRGREVFHTGVRNINTFDELKADVNDFPRFLKILMEAKR